MLANLLRSSRLLLLAVAACASPQFRALDALVEAPLIPLPRYDALGSTAPLTPSAEQWALYQEEGPRGEALLTAVLIGGRDGWQVELTRRSRRHVERHLIPLNRGNNPFLRIRRGQGGQAMKRVIEVPAGRFVGSIASGQQLFHPRVPIHGLLRGQAADGTRWRLLRFGLDQPPNAR
mgnify:CR=1 FL=1